MGTIIVEAADLTLRGVCHRGVRVGDGGRRRKGEMAVGVGLVAPTFAVVGAYGLGG
jgi:hypothetical protein